jgi:hypothetical protein
VELYGILAALRFLYRFTLYTTKHRILLVCDNQSAIQYTTPHCPHSRQGAPSTTTTLTTMLHTKSTPPLDFCLPLQQEWMDVQRCCIHHQLDIAWQGASQLADSITSHNYQISSQVAAYRSQSTQTKPQHIPEL